MTYGRNSYKNKKESHVDLFTGFKREEEGRGKIIGVELTMIESGDTHQKMIVVLEGYEIRELAEELLDRAVQLEALNQQLPMNHEARVSRLKEFSNEHWNEERKWVVKPKKDLVG